MGKGLGRVLGTVAGGIAGSFVGQPMAGASIGGALGGSLDGDTEAERNASRQQRSMNKSVNAVGANIPIAEALDKYLMQNADKGVEYAQNMMDQWETAFGSVEKNLSDYYNSLDPTKFSQQAKTQYAQELDKTMKQYNETMTQRGLQTSGTRAQLDKEAMFEKAKFNAGSDIAAPEKVAQMQQGWWQQGKDIKANAQQSQINAVNNQNRMAQIGSEAKMQANTNMAKAYMGKSDFFGARAAQDSGGGLSGTIGSLIGGANYSTAAGSAGEYGTGNSFSDFFTMLGK